MTRKLPSAADLLAAGWRRLTNHLGEPVWAPPWPDTFTYSPRAAQLTQRQRDQRTPRHKAKPLNTG